MIALPIALLALIILALIIVYLNAQRRRAHIIDRIEALAKRHGARLSGSAPLPVNAPRPMTPFRKTPIEMERLKQRLKQLKYAHSLGAVKKEAFNAERAQIGKKMRSAAHRR